MLMFDRPTTKSPLAALPKSEDFDFAFIDADKPNYRTYYEEILLRLRPGGLLLVDNVMWGGSVVNPDANDANSVAIRAFNDHVAADERVDKVMLAISDGLTIARKRGAGRGSSAKRESARAMGGCVVRPPGALGCGILRPKAGGPRCRVEGEERWARAFRANRGC